MATTTAPEIPQTDQIVMSGTNKVADPTNNIIGVDAVTEGKIDGEGSFDKLMASLTLHLDKQYNDGKIRGPEYSKVYLGLVTAAMQQATSFTLQRQVQEQLLVKAKLEAKLVAKQAQLVDAQINTEEANTEDTSTGTAGLTQDNLKAQISLVQAKRTTEEAQTKDTVVQTNATDRSYETTETGVAGVLGNRNSVYSAQSTGFTRDAEQKTLKIMADAFNVQYSADPTLGADAVDEWNTNPANAGETWTGPDGTVYTHGNRPYLNVQDYGLGYSKIKEVVDKALEGIDIPPPAP